MIGRSWVASHGCRPRSDRSVWQATRGLSVIEIMVVIALSSLIMLGGSVLLSRTSRGYKKGTDMINTQVLLDSIVERLRTDIRSLVLLEEAKPHRLKFVANLRGEPRRIVYEYQPDTRTLTRSERGAGGPTAANSLNSDSDTNFRGVGLVMALGFVAVMDPQDASRFHHLDLAIQLLSNEPGHGPGSSLSIMCHFYSKCLEAYNPYRR